MKGLPCKNIELPLRRKLSKPTHCNICKIELTPKTWKHYMGRINLRCKECIKDKAKKYTARRKKALQQNKWF